MERVAGPKAITAEGCQVEEAAWQAVVFGEMPSAERLCLGAGEVAQAVKRLPCKREDLSLIPSTRRKSGMVVGGAR